MKEQKLRPETQNYFNKITEDNKPERPKKKFIGGKDCLNKEFSDISPIDENKPHRKKDVTKEYELRLHQEKNRNAITRIPQKDNNIFGFQEPEKERPHIKRFQEEFPSKFYKDFNNRHMLANQLGENKPSRKYEGKQNKDNIDVYIGKSEPEKIHIKIGDNTKSNMKDLLENSEIKYPPKYKEATAKPGSINSDILLPTAKSNLQYIEKNGKNKRKIDF